MDFRIGLFVAACAMTGGCASGLSLVGVLRVMQHTADCFHFAGGVVQFSKRLFESGRVRSVFRGSAMVRMLWLWRGTVRKRPFRIFIYPGDEK